MKRPVFFIFIAYIWTKTLLGLTISPYKSVRQVTRNPILLPVVLSPLYGLAALFMIGRIGSILLDVHGFKREILAAILSSALISILMWQLLLLYLLGSFLFALRRH
ncbi:MAG: hypothetical protein HYT11_04695 [Candidatus Levybacteria bacterium]|nr:hypothetical protein [Candidatus Levybacteria bacterium]